MVLLFYIQNLPQMNWGPTEEGQLITIQYNSTNWHFTPRHDQTRGLASKRQEQ